VRLAGDRVQYSVKFRPIKTRRERHSGCSPRPSILCLEEHVATGISRKDTKELNSLMRLHRLRPATDSLGREKGKIESRVSPWPTTLPQISKAALIFNPVARRMRGDQAGKLRQVLDPLTAEGIKVEVSPTAGPQDASNLARRAIAAHCQLVIACGGDGTANEVISGMAGSRVPLLVIPGGTANVLARELALPSDFSRCAALIRDGAIRRISLGKVGSRFFILMAGVGADAGIIAALSSRLKRYLGEGAFWLTGFQQVVKYHFAPFDLKVDGESYRGTFAIVSKAKNYAGSFQLTPTADLFSNQFQICLFQSLNRWRYLYYLSQAMIGRHSRLPDVKVLSGQSVEALGPSEVQVQVDGELMGSLPQRFTIEEDALSLVVPRSRSTDQEHV
jgi:diacylglycerol kinase (ATP)